MLTFQTECTEEDIITASRLMFSPWLKYALLVVGVIALCASVLEWSIFTSPFGIIMGSICVSFPYTILTSNARQLFRTSPAMRVRDEWGVDDDVIKIRSTIIEAQMKWAAFTRVKQNEQIIVLFISNSQAYVLPRRFLTDEQWEELKRLVATHIDGAKKS